MGKSDFAIGHHIKLARLEMGLTGQMLCKATGIPRHTLSLIETGCEFPTIFQLIVLQEALLICFLPEYQFVVNDQGKMSIW